MASVIEGVRLKLVRAQKHIEELREYAKTTYQRERDEIFGQFDPERPNELVLKVRVKKPPDPYLGAILGDAIQNCRSVLDHIFSALVDAAGGDSRRAYFPIFDSRAKYVGEAVPLLVKYGLPDGQIALIESLQPFNGVVRPVKDHPGVVLRVLANIDKHHALTTQIGTHESLDLRVIVSSALGTDTYDIPRIRRTIFLDPECETEITRITLVPQRGFPGGWVKVQVDGELRTRLWIERKWRLTLASLGVVIWVRDDVVARFEPVLIKL